jgi:hypothetical protein
MHPKPAATTPEDFPSDTMLGAVSGAIPRQLGRKIDGKFVAGMTDEELYLRYDASFEMVNQIVEYCHRKLSEQPELEGPELFNAVRKVLAARDEWDFSVEEQAWMMKKLCSRMKWPEPT